MAALPKEISKNEISKKVLMQKQSMYMMGIYEIGATNNGMPTKIIKRHVLISRITSVLVELKCIFEQGIHLNNSFYVLTTPKRLLECEYQIKIASFAFF